MLEPNGSIEVTARLPVRVLVDLRGSEFQPSRERLAEFVLAGDQVDGFLKLMRLVVSPPGVELSFAQVEGG